MSLKKLMFLSLLFTVIFIIGSCNDSNPNSDEKLQSSAITKQVDSSTYSSKGKENSSGTIRNSVNSKRVDPFALAKKGKVTGLEFGIGSDSKEIINKLGKPKDEGNFNGGYFLSYDTLVFFTDGWNSSDGQVMVISLAKGKELCGIKIGIKPSGIKKVLGKPASEKFVGDNDELNGGNWELSYDVGKYSVSFYSKDKDSPTESGQLQKKK